MEILITHSIIFFYLELNILSRIISLLAGTQSIGAMNNNSNKGPAAGNQSISSRMLTVPVFLAETLTDNLNIFKLIQYIEQSKIAHKV